MTFTLRVDVRSLWHSTVLLGAISGCAGSTEGEPNAPQPGPQSGQQLRHGFQEYVKNPELFRQERREMARSRSAPAASREAAALVSAMGRRRLDPGELQSLRGAGENVAPLLERALHDPEFMSHRYGKNPWEGSTLETALDLLEPFALPEASLLEPALHHSDETLRCTALYHLARCGNDDAIEGLVAGLKSSSERCRSRALMGLQFLKDSSRGSKRFRAVLFDASLPLLSDQKPDVAEHVPGALLALDLSRARSVLLGQDVFRPQNESISLVLRALRDQDVAVPGPQLRELLAGIKPKAGKYPFESAYGVGLILLARADGTGAGDLIEDARTWGSKRIKEDAASASEAALGIKDARGFVHDLCERKGLNGLTGPQLDYLALAWLDGEVNNGGFSQYYFNSSGDLAVRAATAARSTGSVELAGLIEKANSLFGKEGPNPDRDKRMDQLSKIDEKALEDLADRYYESNETMAELLSKIVTKNATDFRPGR